MQKNILFGVKVAAIALVIFIQTLETNATWGDFDTSFGFQGAAGEMIIGYNPRSVALLPDGKRILVTGYRTTSSTGDRFFLRRYLPNGQLDTAFGTNGAAIGPEANSIATLYRGDAIVVQANGKIAVAGWANGYNAVWQFQSNGQPDKTFGVNGLQILTNYPVICATYPGMSTGYPEMNVQTGKLLLSLGKKTGENCRVALVRLTSSGMPDGTFGSAGESLTSISGGNRGFGTVVETDGKITVGGVNFENLYPKVLERKLANGQDDLTFSPTAATFSFGIISPGLVKMTNGKYAMRWGNTWPGSVTLMLDKFSPAGIFESYLWVYNQPPTEGCPDVFTNQNDGKLIVQYLGLLFRANNEIDGHSIEINDCSNLGGMTKMARAAIQSDDKMVVAGVYNNYLMLVRLLPN